MSQNTVINLTSQTVAEPELTITIARVDIGNRLYYYDFFLITRRDIKLKIDHWNGRSQNISEDRMTYFKASFDNINSMFENNNYDRQRIINTIRNFGNELYQEFAGDLHAVYRDIIHDKIQTIQLVTQRDSFFPWELLIPNDSRININREQKFLCEIHNITRWFGGGIDDCETIPMKDIGVICSKHGLISAVEEVNDIESLFLNKREHQIRKIDASYDSIIEAISQTSTFSAIHYIGHNVDLTNSGMAFLELNQDRLDASEIPYNHCKNQLFIFLNACESGLLDIGFTEPKGWASVFVKNLKCSVFIGSIWKVPDKSAKNFAISLYTNLLDDMPIGEAVRKARCNQNDESIVGTSSITIDPANYGYVVYAYPCARISFVTGT